MSPVPARYLRHTRLLYSLFSVVSQYVHRTLRNSRTAATTAGTRHLFKRCEPEHFDPHKPSDIVFAVLIPVLVLSSGLFAGLTLGYMSLDETQLNVLSISGTPKQREYANKIKPIRQNGHLLLVTLLLANMITNETLPIVADPVLGGGVESVVASTVLIVIFSEIIPQSLFTRHGLFLGAKMAGFTKFLIYFLGIISWPVAKILEFALGPHHGIIYRRAELKELIAMHSTMGTHGGDLKTDTVTIIGATLDLQEKVVRQAMTPIKDVFMLSIDASLDYDLLKQICLTGHSRVPVYEEVELNGNKVKKILGILLVKQCVLLDPKDAIPLRKIPLNKVPFIPNNEPLLGLLDKFQEGRSHMAIVSRYSMEKAASVKHAVKRGLAQRLRERVGMGDTDSSSSSDEDEKKQSKEANRRKKKTKHKSRDLEEGISEETEGDETLASVDERAQKEVFARRGRKQVKDFGAEEALSKNQSRRTSFQLPKAAAGMASISTLEQSMPADAVLGKEGVADFLQNFDPAVMPLGIITLEDVLEELIGEEIYDEFDPQGAHGDPYVPPAAPEPTEVVVSTPNIPAKPNSILKTPPPTLKPLSLKGLNFLRSRSAPPTPREVTPGLNALTTGAAESPAVLSSIAASDSMSTDADVSASSEVPSTATAVSTSAQMMGVLPEVIIERDTPSPTPSMTPTVPDEPIPNPTPEVRIHIHKPVPVHPGVSSAVASRSASPAPSLEAILLDRKAQRRLGAAATAPSGSIASSVVSTPGAVLTPGGTGLVRLTGAPSVPKGTMFKSSPLGGGERVGVVVAEKVKGAAGEGDRIADKGKDEGDRIPNEKDKEGPDK
ncbi:CNNM transmembrane domain-containing protein [Mycena chlorophos]|uniref:CNNM transmembrane domain-containing protein n=1 Tax=Mycena chlorophos TaxID=658473 RepID=A0A8H6W7T9_MYCCL|nr:CNNM transmembrane domain-containing protein [Mycena chlorophos]